MLLNDDGIVRTMEYLMISEFYGTRRAERSQVPLINHIDEGLFIMGRRGVSITARRAFCLHPMVQKDEDLKANWMNVSANANRNSILLAMEYRNIANQYLSHRHITDVSEIAISPLDDVNEMLIADKIQNWKDFMTYHHATHPRSRELTEYFNNWLIRLNMVEEANQMKMHIGLTDCVNDNAK